MKKLLLLVVGISLAGCSPEAARPPVRVQNLSPEQKKAQLAKEKQAQKVRLAAESARKEKARLAQLAEQKRVAKKERDAKRAERRVMRIVRRELPSYEKGGMKWRTILIRPNARKSDMVKLAQKLHNEDPTGNFHFVDNDSQFEQFRVYDINYPDPNYPYPEEWADNHIVGMLNKMAGEWQLGDGMGQRIAPLTGDFTAEGDSTTSAIWVSPSGKIWSGVKLYFGPSKMYVGEILGGSENHTDESGNSFRGVKVRHPNGDEDWKDRDAINGGNWFVKENDPAIAQSNWQDL